MAVIVILVMFGAFYTVFAAEKIKFAVASDGKTATSNVYQLAGKTPFILFFDAKGGFLEATSNPFVNEASGIGPKLIDMVSKKGATVFIAGTFGDNLKAMALQKGVKLIEGSGKAADVVKKNLK